MWWLALAAELAVLGLAVMAEDWLEFARCAFMAFYLSRVLRVDEKEIEELAEEGAPLLLIAGLTTAIVSIAAAAYVIHADDPLSLAKAALVAWELAPRITLYVRR